MMSKNIVKITIKINRQAATTTAVNVPKPSPLQGTWRCGGPTSDLRGLGLRSRTFPGVPRQPKKSGSRWSPTRPKRMVLQRKRERSQKRKNHNRNVNASTKHFEFIESPHLHTSEGHQNKNHFNQKQDYTISKNKILAPISILLI